MLASYKKPPLTSITLFDSATSTATTITYPTGIQAGDLIVLLDHANQNTSPPTTVVPTGFTSISNVTLNAATEHRQIASYKLADGTETGSLTGMSSGIARQKEMYVFRGNVAASTLTVGSVGSEATTGNPTSQTVTSSGGVAPLVVLGCYYGTGDVLTRTFSPAKTGEISAAAVSYLAYRIYDSSPANVSIDMNDEGDNILQSFYIEMI